MTCSTNRNPIPPCPEGFIEKTNKYHEQCCYVSKNKTNLKELIIFNLNTLISHHRSSKEPFKVNAYKKALDKIKLIDVVNSENDIQDIGGEKTKEKLKTIINTKENLPQVQQIINDSQFNILNQLMMIHGIGPVKAQELVNTHNIKSIADLKKNEQLLNDVQKRGLKYHSQILKRIPRDEMVLHDTFLKSILKNFTFNITGSYRRQAVDSGDIDILLTGSENNLKDCKEILLKSKYLLADGIFADGEHKIMAMCRLKKFKVARRVDLLYTPLHEYPFALLYFTGNQQFNISMRAHALSLGYTLNEQGLFHNNSKNRVEHIFTNEKDIFDFLNFPFVEPQKRM
jgi:DNA polymerase/3'-5' exonuclease PolX